MTTEAIIPEETPETADARTLAACYEHEWSDILFPDRTMHPKEYVQYPRAGRHRFIPSRYYLQAAEMLLDTIDRIDAAPENAVEIGGAGGRFALELMKRCRSLRKYTLSDADPGKTQIARNILEGNAGDELSVPVLASQSETVIQKAQLPAIRIPKDRVELDIVTRSLESPDWPMEQADVLACLNVIDHVENPQRFFVQLKRLLKKDGLLMLSCPLDWHEEFTPIARWREDLTEFLDSNWRLLSMRDFPFLYRSRPRRLIVFSSQTIVIQRVR